MGYKQKGWTFIQPFCFEFGFGGSALGLADSEHLGSAAWADTLSCRLAILHGDGFGVLNLFLAAALDTIGLHPFPPLVL